MSEIYHHLLIPRDPLFQPARDRVRGFFLRFKEISAMPREAAYTVVLLTGNRRAYARDAKTGETLYGPELKVGRYASLDPALESTRNEENFDLGAAGDGPASLPPFELYNANRPDMPSKDAYPFSVWCRQRSTPNYFGHSPFGCKCDLAPDVPGIFKNPWTDAPIETAARGCARFWIEIRIGGWLMPMIADSFEILDPRLVSATQNVFGVEFGQGCVCNDD